eukprot:Mrub_09133.p1 GENE.Mrub_09133~~Mrub_09133.p1  ORF type:complete len:251 (+),score=40.41 Mrub_09133:2-754(+)
MLKNILIIGGSGSLGKSIITKFLKCNLNQFCIYNLDYNDIEISNLINQNSHKQNYIQIADNTFTSIGTQMIHDILSDLKFDSMICTAGGFDMCNFDSDDLFPIYNKLKKQNVYSSLLLSNLATKFLKEKGMVMFTGADAVYTDPKPELLPYILTKTATHTISYLLEAEREKGDGLVPHDSSVITILPTVLDTEVNRQVMQGNEEMIGKMVHPEGIAKYVYEWSEHSNRPRSGSFVSFTKVNDTIQPNFYN